MTHRARVPGHEFAAREATFIVGQAAQGLGLAEELASAALRTMREGECATFWLDARLAPGRGGPPLWSEGRYEWVEEGYEWEVEVSACGPAALAPSSCVAVRGGLRLPRLGLGLYMVSPMDAYASTLEALRLGYRLIDTASMYQNEAAVGRALRDARVGREEITLVSKVNNPDHGYHEALKAVELSRAQLGVTVIDLMLIHSPLGGRVLETWDALLEARRRGWVEHVGVSNFGVGHLQRMAAAGREPPVVNQFELSPFCQEPELRRFCARRGIALMGYSPLTRGERLQDRRVAAVARRHGRSPAQILIRWALQQGVASIPKTTRPERLRENLGAFDFSLGDADLAELGACEERLHTCWDCLNAPWTG